MKYRAIVWFSFRVARPVFDFSGWLVKSVNAALDRESRRLHVSSR